MDDQTIFRFRHDRENPYFMMRRDTAQDKSLSFEALGMLAYLLSKPDDWTVRIADLERENSGRDKTQRVLKELLDKGYAKHEQQSQDRESGRFQSLTWYIYEAPYTENPLTGEPLTVNPLLQSNDIQSTEVQKPNGATNPFAPMTTIPLQPTAPVMVSTESGRSARVAVAAYPAVAYSLFQTLERHHIKSNGLSPNQYSELVDKEVTTPVGQFLAPQKEMDAYPDEWKEYMEHLEDAPGWKQFSEKRVQLTLGTLIEFIRAYHHKGRWLDYRTHEHGGELEPEDWSRQ